jgi:hypothetical protein
MKEDSAFVAAILAQLSWNRSFEGGRVVDVYALAGCGATGTQT